MGTNILVDTSAWICSFGNKHQRVKNFIKEGLDRNIIATSGVIMLELLQGAKTQKEYNLLRDPLLALKFLPETEQFWLGASDLAFMLKRKGLTVPTTDIIIAYQALDNDCLLLHFDKHFDFIAQNSNLKALNIEQLL